MKNEQANTSLIKRLATESLKKKSREKRQKYTDIDPRFADYTEEDDFYFDGITELVELNLDNPGNSLIEVSSICFPNWPTYMNVDNLIGKSNYPHIALCVLYDSIQIIT